LRLGLFLRHVFVEFCWDLFAARVWDVATSKNRLNITILHAFKMLWQARDAYGLDSEIKSAVCLFGSPIFKIRD